MSSELMIQTQDLTKSYGSFTAVDRISFEVRRGEIVGFLGPNGAGKSTTMRILTCYLAPTGGTARVNGKDVFSDTLGVRQSLGYLPQRAPLYLDMSVLEYLQFAADLRELDASTFKKRARNVVEVCGLAQVLGKEISELSHGYRQRVGLAQALIHDPPILILDEPTSDLDPNEKTEFLEYLKRIGQERTVLLSTHNLSEVEAACARAIIVSRGRVVADGALSDIRARSGSVSTSIMVAAENMSGSSVSQVEIKSALDALKGVSKVEAPPSNGQAYRYELATPQDVDLRADLYRLAVQKGWVLLELVRASQALEDVFRDLTLGDERKNREISAA